MSSSADKESLGYHSRPSSVPLLTSICTTRDSLACPVSTGVLPSLLSPHSLPSSRSSTAESLASFGVLPPSDADSDFPASAGNSPNQIRSKSTKFVDLRTYTVEDSEARRFSISEDSKAQRSVKARMQKRQANRKDHEDVQPTFPLSLDPASSKLAGRRRAAKFQAFLQTSSKHSDKQIPSIPTNKPRATDPGAHDLGLFRAFREELVDSVQRMKNHDNLAEERSTRAAAKLIIDQPNQLRRNLPLQ